MFYSLGALNRADIDLILLLRKTVTETSMYRTFRMRPASPPSLDTSAQSTRVLTIFCRVGGGFNYTPHPLSARGGVGEALSARGDDLRVVLNPSTGLKWC